MPAAATAVISALMDSRLSGLPVTRRITSWPSARSSASRSCLTTSPSTSSKTAAVGGAGRGGLRRAPASLAAAQMRSYSSSAASRSSCGTGTCCATMSRTPCDTAASVTTLAVVSRTSRARTVSRSGLPGPAPTKTTLPRSDLPSSGWVSGTALLIRFFSSLWIPSAPAPPLWQAREMETRKPLTRELRGP